MIATGGLSIPKIGATDFAFRIAKQFGLKLIERRGDFFRCPASLINLVDSSLEIDS